MANNLSKDACNHSIVNFHVNFWGRRHALYFQTGTVCSSALPDGPPRDEGGISTGRVASDRTRIPSLSRSGTRCGVAKLATRTSATNCPGAGTDEATVRELATSMGLPAAGRVPERMKDRGYITIVRRNWHLLPCEKLLTLLDMSADQLDFSLREDVFLYITLGTLKPKCKPVKYETPNDVVRRRAEPIRQIVAEHFGGALQKPGEEWFAFIEELSRSSGKRPLIPTEKRADRPLRFI